MNDSIAPFALLKSLDDGKVMDDFHQAIAEVTYAVRMAHKKGKVILTIEMDPGDVDVSKIDVRGDVTLKSPHIQRGAKTFYVTEDNGLSTRNPRQPNPHPNTVTMPPMEDALLDGQSRAAGEKA